VHVPSGGGQPVTAATPRCEKGKLDTVADAAETGIQKSLSCPCFGSGYHEFPKNDREMAWIIPVIGPISHRLQGAF